MEDNKQKEEQVKKIEINFNKTAYDKSFLNQEQIEQLKNKGYKEFSETIFNTNKTYFLKSQDDEEIACLFNLCAITDLLRSKGLDAKLTRRNKKFFVEVQ